MELPFDFDENKTVLPSFWQSLKQMKYFNFIVAIT